MPRFVLRNGERYVHDTGAGHPVVLLHGFPLDHSMWSAQIDELSKSYRVLAPDFCGFGQSAVDSGTITMTRHAEDVSDLLQALEIQQPVTVCGLSMGGYVALAFWQHFRHQLGALILCDTRAAADTQEALDRRFRLADVVLEHGTHAVAEAMIPQLFAAGTLEAQPDTVDQVRQLIHGADRQGVAAALHGMAARRDMTTRLAEIEQPALLVVGSEDQLTPPDEMRLMAEALPAGQLSVIDGAGHMAPMEQPQLVNTAITQFLDRLPTA